MRYAIITDIHGNIFALERALGIVQNTPDVDKIICLGDNFSLGSAPLEVLNRLQQLNNAVFIRGNHDRYLVENIWEYERPTIEGMDPDDPVCIDIVANEKWTAEQVGEPGRQFIKKMRMSYFENIGKTYIEFTHAWFGRDDFPPTLEEVKKWRDHAKTKHIGSNNFVFVHGHIHIPRNEQFGNLKLFCPGSTGLPFDENQQGVVAFLTVEGDSINWDVKRFEYDTEAALQHLEEIRPPFYRNLYSTIKYASIRNDLVE
ncbi:MAG: metallophosphatase family protein [Candidatus Marinimicrobia bacterium]|nr:metallophosphatase family protein [Candidatus Neomarinimicrobiota bacterium]